MVMAAPKVMTDSINTAHKVETVTLSNDGELSLYFIGAGAAFAKSLGQNNLLIVKGQDHLLIDCGSKCSQSLHDAGLPIAQVENYLITHSHADHVGGLEEVQLFGRYVSHKKPNMVINEHYQKILWEQSLRGGSEMNESTPLTFEDLWTPIRPTKLTTNPRETWEVQMGDINIKMPRTMHVPDDAKSWKDSFWSVGIIIDDRILYTSDTRFDPKLLTEFDERYDFDVIFHDCQLFTGGVHASLNELKTLPAQLKQKIILMHYGDDWRDFEQEALDDGFQAWAKEKHEYRFNQKERKRQKI